MHAIRFHPLPVYQHLPMQLTPDGKPTLLFLRRDYNRRADTHLTSQQVADAAGVPLWSYFQAEIGCPTHPQDAARILPTLSRLIGLPLTLNDVYLPLKPALEGRHG